MLLSALYLSEKYKYQLRVNWRKQPELNCDFEDLFLPIPNVEFYDGISGDEYLKTSFVKSRKYKFLNYLHNKLKHRTDVFYNNDFEAHKTIWKIEGYLKQGKTIYLQTCESFYKDFPNEIDRLKPVEKINQKVLEKTSTYPAEIYGMHIRRTDHSVAIKESSDAKFEMIIKQYPNASFYLSTDDENVEKYFKEQFGSRIITSEKEFTRDSPLGIEGALIDILCLSKTNKIFGSFYSSFSEFASYFGRIRLEIVK